MTKSAPHREDEHGALDALDALDVLDSEPEMAFDELVRTASLACGVPISLITLIDRDRQWFKANVGLEGLTETPRDVAFCAHAVLDGELFEVPDATKDARFSANPLVLGDPSIRFYAGAPIHLRDGHRVGTLCVIDRTPRTLTPMQREILQSMSNVAAQMLEGRRAMRALRRSEAFLDRTGKIAGVGGWEYDVATAHLVWSAEMRRIHGVGPEYRPALQAALSFFPPDSTGRLQAAYSRCMEGGTSWNLELPFKRADGAARFVRTVGSAQSASGKLVRLIGTLQDVTDQVLARQALKDANDRVALATDAGGIGVWEIDLATRGITWDDRMFALYGVEGRDAISSDEWRERLPRESYAALRSALDAAVSGTSDVDLQHSICWPDGTVRHLKSAARLTRDPSGRPVRLIGTSWDVTEALEVAAEISEQRRIASIQAKIAVAANESTSLTEAFRTCIDLLCGEGSEWELGHVYVRSADDSDRLIPTGIWNAAASDVSRSFRQETARTSFTPEVGTVGAVLREKKPVVVQELGAESFRRFASASESGLRRTVAAPVQVGDRVMAVLEFYSSRSGPIDERFLSLATYAGLQLGRVVDRERNQMLAAQQTEGLRAQSMIDELTQLYNRRGFMKLAEERLRSGQRSFLLFADLDGMKRINDELGHEAGDVALVETAGVLRRTLRSSDIIARLGGDEFVALTSETGSFDPDALVARIESDVSRVNKEGRLPFTLAMSVGVSGPAEQGTSVAEMLKRADELMYEKKQARKAKR